MPVKEIPAFELSCDNCDYVAEMDENEVMVFDSIEAAVKYAVDAGWRMASTGEIHWFSCLGCGGR
jgi:hypothetical protein